MNENENLEPVGKLTPFTKMVMSIGTLPSSFYASMSYYESMVWLYEYLKNEVIPTVNGNAAAVEELQTKYLEFSSGITEEVTDFKSYITGKVDELEIYMNNYFTNLDVQEEINNKLDEMATDGTLEEIVEIYASPILSNLTQNVESLENTVNNTVENIKTPIELLREENSAKYKEVNVPFTTDTFLKNNFKIYQSEDKANYKIYYNLTNHKASGGNTYYVSTNGNDNNDGTSEQAAWRTLRKVLNDAPAGSTVYIKKGIYRPGDLGSASQFFTKSLNLIGEDGVYIIHGNELSWSQNSTYTNVYQATRSNVKRVINATGWNQNLFCEMTRVYSLEACSTTLNSYYDESNTTLYVNNGGVVNNDNTIVTLSFGYNTLQFKPEAANTKYYLENLTIFGANFAGIYVTNDIVDTSTIIPEFTAKNVKVLYTGGPATNRNAFCFLGSKSFLIDCEASYSDKDGISYNENNTVGCYGIEINCKGSYNGVGGDNSNNGSTAHGGSHVIRFNCNYFGNGGINVADTHANTKSLNIMCNSYDSLASANDAKYDFASLNEGTVMYLVNCYSKGSTSICNLIVYNGSYLYVNNTLYDTQGGGGTFDTFEY